MTAPAESASVAESYLIRLVGRLAGGLESLSIERKARHRDRILSFQQPDGGFAGRAGGSDLYYTSFAVRALAILDQLDVDCARETGRYLKASLGRSIALVDLVSLFYTAITVNLAGAEDPFVDADGDWTTRLPPLLESFRVADGGYAKTHEGAAGSMYNSFLVSLCYDMLGQRPPNEAALVEFVRSRQREDGGFVEIRPMKRSGTNPTAAAANMLLRMNAFSNEVRDDVAEFLKEVCGDEGGFLANTQIPICDLLSTFTGLLTTLDLELAGIVDPDKVRTFALSLEQENGGFLAAAWDKEVDPEYTFYGLGTLALLESMATGKA